MALGENAWLSRARTNHQLGAPFAVQTRECNDGAIGSIRKGGDGTPSRVQRWFVIYKGVDGETAGDCNSTLVARRDARACTMPEQQYRFAACHPV